MPNNRLAIDDATTTLHSLLTHAEDAPTEPPDREALRKKIPITIKKTSFLGIISPLQLTVTISANGDSTLQFYDLLMSALGRFPTCRLPAKSGHSTPV